MTFAAKLAEIQATKTYEARLQDFNSLARVLAMRSDPKLRGRTHMLNDLPDRVKKILNTAADVYKWTPLNIETQKTAAAVGTTSDSTWAGPLADYQSVVGAFLESLRGFGAFDAMLPFMKVVPFRTRVGAISVGATGYRPGHSHPKPISALTVTGATIDEARAAVVLVITKELSEFSAGGDLFARELAGAVAQETDEGFVSILTTGATAITSTGADAEAVRNDLRIASLLLTTSARSKLFLLLQPALLRNLALLHTNTGAPAFPELRVDGGDIHGITCVASDGVPSGSMVLVDAIQVAAATSTMVLDATEQASVQLNDAPDSPPTASTSYVSLWQMNWLGLRAERFYGATKLTTNAAVVISSINYTGSWPGP
jgi:hypothetical protein